MEENENFIRENIPLLLSHPRVKSETGEIGGEWKLLDDQIQSFHAMLRNIEFLVIFVNEVNRCVRVEAKINRETAKISNVKVQEI